MSGMNRVQILSFAFILIAAVFGAVNAISAARRGDDWRLPPLAGILNLGTVFLICPWWWGQPWDR